MTADNWQRSIIAEPIPSTRAAWPPFAAAARSRWPIRGCD